MTEETLPGEKRSRKLLLLIPALFVIVLITVLIFFPLSGKAPEGDGTQTEETLRPEEEIKISKAELDKKLKDIVYAQISGEAAPLMEELKELSPSDAGKWEELLSYWEGMSGKGFVNIREDDDTAPLPETLPRDDSLCIVVLGFQLNTDGSMRGELEKRLNMALAAAKQYPRAFVCVTGGHTASGNLSASEGGVMAAWLKDQGIPEERIISETDSRTTVENAVFCQRIFAEEYPQISEVAIVTSDYHIKLGSLLFDSRFILQGSESPRVTANAANRTGGDYYFTPRDEAYWLSNMLSYE